jgi:glutathione synthase/RimK-type ligase-like ATP-grasp enzyme
MKRVGILTSAQFATGHPEDAPLFAALSERGLTWFPREWRTASGRWSDADGWLIRTTWDYWRHPHEYDALLGDAEKSGVRFWNPPLLARWNMDKRYLVDLANRGIDVVPTLVLDETARARPAMVREGWEQAVLKPAISAAGWQTHRVTPEDVDERERSTRAEVGGTPLLLQPFVSEIERGGELSLLFVEGEFCHAVSKVPAPGEFRVQEVYGGIFAQARPTRKTIQAAANVLGAIPTGAAPLYARIDGVLLEERFLLMEAELLEPSFFFAHGPETAARLAAAVARRLEQPC